MTSTMSAADGSIAIMFETPATPSKSARSSSGSHSWPSIGTVAMAHPGNSIVTLDAVLNPITVTCGTWPDSIHGATDVISPNRCAAHGENGTATSVASRFVEGSMA